MADSRAAAAQTLATLLKEGCSFDSAYLPSKLKNADPRDIALYKELCFGSLRQFYFLDTLTSSYLKKALGKKDWDLRALLIVGAYQLIFMRVPDHACLSSTVESSKTLKKHWAKGMVNAILRNIIKLLDSVDRTDLNAVIDSCRKQITSEAALNAHPDWLYQKINKDLPEHAVSIFSHNNTAPVMNIRIADIAQLISVKANLREQGIEAAQNKLSQQALTLDKPIDVHKLPGFDSGAVSVQDAGAQLAATFFNLDSDAKSQVLDACAAPGGKTLHLLQANPGIALTALDASTERLEKVRQNLQRAGKTAQLKAADAANLDSWWDGKLFDAILLDAPCTGSGVINRHPDIKLLRREDDIATFVNQQWRLISSLWQTLKIGGQLLYCTCSIFKEENQSLVEKFISAQKDASLVTLDLPSGIDTGWGHQLLPNIRQNDGFFFAKIDKEGSSFENG